MFLRLEAVTILVARVGLGTAMSRPTTGLGSEMVSRVGRGLLGITILLSSSTTEEKDAASLLTRNFSGEEGRSSQ